MSEDTKEILNEILDVLELQNRILRFLLEDSIRNDEKQGIFKKISEDMEDNAFWRFYDKKTDKNA